MIWLSEEHHAFLIQSMSAGAEFMHPYHRTVTSAPQHTAAAMIDDDMDMDDEYRGDNLTDEEVNDLYENEVCGNKTACQPRRFNDFMGRVVPGTKLWELSTLEKRADNSEVKNPKVKYVDNV